LKQEALLYWLAFAFATLGCSSILEFEGKQRDSSDSLDTDVDDADMATERDDGSIDIDVDPDSLEPVPDIRPDDMHEVVDDGCQPDCSGKKCGSDECGGSCGSCPDGITCFEGVCDCSANPAACCECGFIMETNYPYLHCVLPEANETGDPSLDYKCFEKGGQCGSLTGHTFGNDGQEVGQFRRTTHGHGPSLVH
jgi:hypothetical protein